MQGDLVGHNLGPYRILDFTGGDAFTEVYRAFDAENDRPVLIKLVGRNLAADPVFSARFRREARAIASLRHPNIVRVHDFGQAAGGHYVVMDYVDGVPLADLLSDVRRGVRSLDAEDVTFLIRQVASALEHAHREGVVHRSVNPDSILLLRSGQAILADFGLSLLAAAEDNPHAAVANREYVAPEVQADLRAASPAADIYALGVVLYELLTGEHPYVLASEIDVALRDLGGSAPDPRLINPDLPEAVAEVAINALAPSPRDRFRTPMHLAAALERAYTLGTPPSRPSTAPTPVTRPARRGGSTREERQEKRRLREETQQVRREARARRRGKEASAARRRPLARTLLAVALLIALLGGAAAVLQARGLIALPPAAPTPPDSPVAAADAAATADPTFAATGIPTITPIPTATALAPAEASPMAAAAGEGLGIGSSAFRMIDGGVMQFVPAGVFHMGSDTPVRGFDAQPQHRVMLRSYWIDRTEVTNARYALCVAEGLCAPPVNLTDFEAPNKASHPATYIRHSDAVTYCLWLSQETALPIGLPTEAQWEKAAAWDPEAGEARPFPWGIEPPSTDIARFAGSEGRGAAPVGSYPDGASAYGVLDMAGNVWEWAADWYDADAYKRSGIVTDPQGPASGTRRVTRGGGWFNDAALLSSQVRNWASATAAGNDLGFRCVANTGRPPASSGIYLTIDEVMSALRAEVHAAASDPANDADTLAEWEAAFETLSTTFQAGDGEASMALIDERLVRLTIHRSNDLLSATLVIRLDGSLRWMRDQLEVRR